MLAFWGFLKFLFLQGAREFLKNEPGGPHVSPGALVLVATYWQSPRQAPQ